MIVVKKSWGEKMTIFMAVLFGIFSMVSVTFFRVQLDDVLLNLLEKLDFINALHDLYFDRPK